MTASRKRDRVEVTAATTRARQGDIEDLHLCAGIIAPTSSHKRQLAVINFVHPVILDIEHLKLLLDGLEMMMMSLLLECLYNS